MSKQKKLTSAGKEVFIDAVLSMLDEGMNLRELNLRKVAKRVGCAHTNAYNYFTSYEDLLWWSLKGALERMASMVDPDRDDLTEVYVDFALDHPAWYRLIWLDPLGGEPPAGVAEFLPVPGRVYTRWLAARTGTAISGEELETKARIFHGYLHGELAAIAAGRVAGPEEELKKRVLTGAALLFDLLFVNNKTTTKKEKE
jgi:AcrR family transcriptional regulator